jgi:biotin synthase
VDPFELVRMIAVARILMPKSRVRLSAGRTSLSREAQSMCLYAGANSIFYGDRLLTTANPEEAADLELLRTLGLGTLAPADSNEVKIDLTPGAHGACGSKGACGHGHHADAHAE